jgi:hypothetical protein
MRRRLVTNAVVKRSLGPQSKKYLGMCSVSYVIINVAAFLM